MTVKVVSYNPHRSHSHQTSDDLVSCGRHEDEERNVNVVLVKNLNQLVFAACFDMPQSTTGCGLYHAVHAYGSLSTQLFIFFLFNLSLSVLTDMPKELDCYIQLFYSLFCIYNLPIFQYLPQFTARLVSFRIFSRHVSRVKSECILFECQKHFSPLKYQH